MSFPRILTWGCWLASTSVLLVSSHTLAQDAHSITDGTRTLATYQASYLPSPDVDQPWYGRSGFIHPVYTPSGKIVTDAFPIDHRHQHALMFAWTSGRFRGNKVDFWNSHRQQGRVEHVETQLATDNVIRARLRHIDATKDVPVTVLEETWKLKRVPDSSMTVLDLFSEQRCVADEPLQVREYHYGAMCIRGASEWITSGCEMLTGDGKRRLEGNHARPGWVVMSGEVEGQPCGIAAIDHPSNFRYPQPVRLHPKMPYFCFAPMVTGDFEIVPGKPFRSAFRFVAFDGLVDTAQINRLADEFSKVDLMTELDSNE